MVKKASQRVSINCFVNWNGGHVATTVGVVNCDYCSPHALPEIGFI